MALVLVITEQLEHGLEHLGGKNIKVVCIKMI